MSTEILDLQAILETELAAQKQSMPNTTSKISTKGKIFSLPDGTSSEGPIQCIILDWRWQHSYFEGIYNSNNPKPPVCSSSGKIEAELQPDPTSEKPQAEDCESCPKNVFGSGTGGRGKACKNTARLAIVPANPTSDMSPWVLDVPPTGQKQLIGYINELQKQGKLAVQMVTEIDFDPKVDYPTPQFKNKGEHKALQVAFGLREKAQNLLR
jgi:hypothetical protein